MRSIEASVVNCDHLDKNVKKPETYYYVQFAKQINENQAMRLDVGPKCSTYGQLYKHITKSRDLLRSIHIYKRQIPLTH